jgi:very-short-patch-repair endonuclease
MFMGIEACIHDGWLLLRNFREIDKLFAYYLLLHERPALVGKGSGSVFTNLKTEILKRHKVRLPPLPEQRAIAHILGTLDDKIELNRRMSETLEQMARAIFKAWFVDFEPVRAKMNLPSPSGRGAGGEGKKPPLPTILLERARELRKRATNAERLLWQLLRNRQIAGAKFRRQHPIPPYILDFYCHEHRLAVEIDGGQHNQPAGMKRDRRRTEFLREQGIRVLRFWNHEVLNETEAVLQVIYDAVVASSPHRDPHPNPLPGGEGRYPHPGPLPGGEGTVFGGEFRWPQHILDLFPDRLVQSELGEIPEGWRVDKLGNQFRITMGQSPPGSTYNENGEGLPFYQGRVDFGFRFPARQVFCTASTRFAEAGDTLVTVRAPVGDVNMAIERCAIGRGIAAVRHMTGSRSYTYYFVRSLRAFFETFEAEGTVFGAINKEGFSSIKHVVPPRRLVERFEDLCKPLDDQIETNERESRNLAALRDALLPRLISGELRVKDAQKFLEERCL